MIWLGSKRGFLSDWLTQRWVQVTGSKVTLFSNPWLTGPAAPPEGIGPDYFQKWAVEQGLRIDDPGKDVGIIPEFSALDGSHLNTQVIDREVVEFYEKTSAYELDAWSEWCGLFRPFGWLLAVFFSRRLQQLNVPLSGLDTSRGMTNEVLQFRDIKSNALRHTAWFRRLQGNGNILYAGFYSVCHVPGCTDPCVKVVFPLPNGNAIVLMRTECRPDHSFVVTSSGEKFGDAGFYFTVHTGADSVWVRYVRSLRESIHVFPAEAGVVRADHVLHLWGFTFLNLHYRMRKLSPNGPVQASALETSSTR
jgi:hypothetical protein